MILGVDHIALSADEASGAISELEELGFSPRFRDLFVPNHPAKRPFVHQLEAMHAVAYCSGQAPGVAIEITAHGVLRPEGAGLGYGVLLAGLPLKVRAMGSEVLDHPLGTWWRRVGRGSVREVRSPRFKATWWVDAAVGPSANAGSRVGGVMVGVEKLDRSLAFWTNGLGLTAGRGAAEPPRWRMLRPSTPIPQWVLDVFLVEDGSAAKTWWYLDDPGFPCVAFLTTDIHADRDRLQQHGAAEVGEVFELSVAGRSLELCVLRGPSGEPVELIQVTDRRQPDGGDQRGSAHH
jgi:hypothetical protein